MARDGNGLHSTFLKKLTKVHVTCVKKLTRVLIYIIKKKMKN